MMANPSKQRGTAGESAVVAYLISRGWPFCERRTLSGAHDKGDIAGVAGVCIEVKACKSITLGPWLNEVEVEKRNAKARVGVCWFKRRGTTDPGAWFVTMTGEQFTELLIEAGYQ